MKVGRKEHQLRQQKTLNINLNRDKGASRFATDALINHQPDFFRFTFFDTWQTGIDPQGQMNQNKDVIAETILTPQHAKSFLKALGDNIAKYEEKHGEIETPEMPETPATGVTEVSTYHG